MHKYILGLSTKSSTSGKAELPVLGFHAWKISLTCVTEEFQFPFLPQIQFEKIQIWKIIWDEYLRADQELSLHLAVLFELLMPTHVCGTYIFLIHSPQCSYAVTSERKTWDLGIRIPNLSLTFLASFHQSFWHVSMFWHVLDLTGFNRIQLFTDTFNLSPCKFGLAVRNIYIDFHWLPSIQSYMVFFCKVLSFLDYFLLKQITSICIKTETFLF